MSEENIKSIVIKAIETRFKILEIFYRETAGGVTDDRNIWTKDLKERMKGYSDDYIENIERYLTEAGYVKDGHITAKGIDLFEDYILFESEHLEEE